MPKILYNCLRLRAAPSANDVRSLFELMHALGSTHMESSMSETGLISHLVPRRSELLTPAREERTGHLAWGKQVDHEVAP